MAESKDAADAVVIERTLDFPPAFVWKMWTEAEHLRACMARTARHPGSQDGCARRLYRALLDGRLPA